MRKVSVNLKLQGDTLKEIRVTEWVPVVLLGHFQVGDSVIMIEYPARKRITIGF